MRWALGLPEAFAIGTEFPIGEIKPGKFEAAK
jgi:hypothetical protein